MQIDFHYYATYCAAYIAGYSHEESLAVCYSAQFVDCCSRTLLGRIGGPSSAATTQLQLEMMEARTDMPGIQDITRIWSSFHFLPRNLGAEIPRGSKMYKNKYRLICGPNGDLLAETVNLAKHRGLQAAGIAMHVLADTWAHRYFAGTPSVVINNTDSFFYELVPDEGAAAGDGEAAAVDGAAAGSAAVGRKYKERQIVFKHNPAEADDIETGAYINTLFQFSENSVMSLGHGRAGHLPDYSFARYRYLPAWGNYREVVKDNPSDYYHAFCQMICALKFLRGESGPEAGEAAAEQAVSGQPDAGQSNAGQPAAEQPEARQFAKDRYDWEAAAPYEARIKAILETRQLDSSADWKAFGESLSGQEIPDFDIEQYSREYMDAAGDAKDKTFLGQFIAAAIRQKSMVTERIFKSGNLLAGYTIDYSEKGISAIRDAKMLIGAAKKGREK